MIEARLLALIIEALCVVESGGNPAAINGQCVGILQITPVLIEDLNRLAGREKWRLEDRLNQAKSKVMAMDYLLHYGSGNMTIAGLAMPWKKGPTGMWRDWSEADRDYAHRVKQIVDTKNP